jgi:hypothetical protein
MEIDNQKFNFLQQLLKDNSWTHVQTVNGITIEKKMLTGSEIACFQSKGIINCKFEELMQYVWNIYNDKENVCYFDPDVTEYAIIKNIDDHTKICRQVNSLPWPMWSRESVYLQKKITNVDASYIIMYSVDLDDVPVQPNKYVRSNINISAFVFEPYESCTMVRRIVHIDPAGNIPISIINSYATKTTNVISHLMSIYN